MLSRKKALTRRVDNKQHRRCTWREPGNFNRNLSALTWTAQLILFDFVCFQKQDNDRQRLDRIVIDECHLTITASYYRRSISQLAWHVRQIRTQTVWLTATLPPIYQEFFFEHNKLVRPHIVRESTNHPNIRYISYWTRTDLFKSEQDRVIVYCPTKDLVAELADLLGCLSYTADSGTEEERGVIIERWLTAADSPAIIAILALGPRFDYPHIMLNADLLP
ncbi:hypothetical protein DER44DRAFT_679617 [Fusarium oxysporum]|nr:hypothetical protein DER44DRAFT_679617 [Fusarium oxysporum]